MQPIRALAEEHALIRSACRLLEEAAKRVSEGDPVAGPAVRDLLEFFWFFGDRLHQGKEEDLLLPALKAAGIEPEGSPISVTLAEHSEERAHLQMAWHLARTGLEKAPAPDRHTLRAACRRLVSLTEAHIEAEEAGLFPLAEQALDEEQMARLAELFRRAEAREAARNERCRALLARARNALRAESRPRAEKAVG